MAETEVKDWELSVTFPEVEGESIEEQLSDMFGPSESAGTWLAGPVPIRDLQWEVTHEEAVVKFAQVAELFKGKGEEYNASFYPIDDEDDEEGGE